MRCTIEDMPRALCGEAIRTGARRSRIPEVADRSFQSYLDAEDIFTQIH